MRDAAGRSDPGSGQDAARAGRCCRRSLWLTMGGGAAVASDTKSPIYLII